MVVFGWDFVVFLTLDLFSGGMWFFSPYSRSESAHPRLMESDDVVCFSLFSCSGFVVLGMSELDRAGASLNAISLSLIDRESVAILAQAILAQAGDLGWRVTRVLAS